MIISIFRYPESEKWQKAACTITGRHGNGGYLEVRMFDYEDDELSPWAGVNLSARVYNPDKIIEESIKNEIQGKKYKSMNNYEINRRDFIYENFMKVKKVKNTK